MKKWGALIVILILASVLRLWNLSNNPPGLTWDEASLGYNAFSILKTGHDEYRTFLPLNLKSFGDYKPAIYTYLAVPFVAILGLNELAVRLPVALFGIGSVLLVYLLVDQLFKNRTVSLLCAFSYAISPLALQFSRPAFESSVAFFLNLLATLLFLKSFKRPKLMIFSAICFSLSIFTYQASRLFVPILLIGLILIYRKNLNFSKSAVVSLGVIALAGILMIVTVFGLNQANRLATVSLFAYPRSAQDIAQIAVEQRVPSSDLMFQVLHGEWFAYFRGVMERYTIYFSPKTLFISGDPNERDRVPDLGVLYYFSAFFIPLGFYSLIRSGKGVLILYWLAIAPLPAVLSRDLLTMLRGFNLSLPFAVMEGVGLAVIVDYARSRSRIMAMCLLGGVTLLVLVNMTMFLDSYFIHLPKEYSKFWLYGYKQAVGDLQQLTQQKKYDHIIFTDSYGQPYIYYLFYTQYSPEQFQRQSKLEQLGVDVGTVRNIDNISFRHVYWPEDRGLKNSLFIGTAEELPDKDVVGFPQYKVLSNINFLNGLPALRIVETQ